MMRILLSEILQKMEWIRFGVGKDCPDDGTEDDLNEDDEISTLRDSAEGGVNSTVDEVSHKALKDKEANEKCSA